LRIFQDSLKVAGRSPDTIERRVGTLRRFLASIHPATIDQATTDDVEAFLRGYSSPATRSAYLSDLRAFYRYACRRRLLFEDPTPNDTLINPFFLTMLGSITRACARQGYDLLVSFQQFSEDWHADYQDAHKADGLILLGYGDWFLTRDKLDRLVQQGTHFVRWGPVFERQPGMSIGSDNRDGGRQVGAPLAALGRKRVAYLGANQPTAPEFRDRYLGLCDALQAAKLSTEAALQIDVIDSTELAGYAAAQALFARGVAFDAMFCASDLIAIGAMRALMEHGLRVPEDVAVVGFDDQPVAAFTNPPLTTVLQDTKLAGEKLVDTLIREIRGEVAVSEVLSPTLVVRRSCGAGLAAPKPVGKSSKTR
jgi:DNA-binding LacI/PurR family transcriptional regulator